MNKEKVKLVVVNENTLGYISESMPNYLSIFQASTLKGSRFGNLNGSYLLTSKDFVRLANEVDFNEYNCEFSEGYKNDPIFEYEYAK